MLVLSRKYNEAIDVTLPDGRVMTVIVVDIRCDKVRLGVQAPADVTVNRREITEAIAREAKEAAVA
jgi:carbon storage regulator